MSRNVSAFSHRRAPAGPSEPDEWAWGALLAVCQREARRVHGRSSDADDAAQNAALRAWTARTACRSADAPAPWVAQIARREALRLRSHNQARAVADARIAGTLRIADGFEGATHERASVASLLAALPPGDRELLRLRYHQDLPCARVAELLGLHPATVRVRLHRARNRLRVLLADDEQDHGQQRARR